MSNNGNVDRNEVARRAYEIFKARGGKGGCATEDWLKAEREEAAKRSATKPTLTSAKTGRKEPIKSASAR